MKTIIDFFPERLSPPRQGSYTFRNDDLTTLELVKGRNIVEESVLERFRQHPDFDELVKITAILVVSAEPETVKTKNISDFKNVNDAKDAIENTFDRLQLETWLAQEKEGSNRSTVTSAIKKSLDRLDISKLQTATLV